MSSLVIADFPTAKVLVEWNKGEPYTISIAGRVVAKCKTEDSAVKAGARRAVKILAERSAREKAK